jgi:hypothetical protein
VVEGGLSEEGEPEEFGGEFILRVAVLGAIDFGERLGVEATSESEVGIESASPSSVEPGEVKGLLMKVWTSSEMRCQAEILSM